MSTTVRWFGIVALIAALAAIAYLFKYAWYERYVWPSDIPGVADLPPADRSSWPDPPLPLDRESQEVLVATPDGLATREISYLVNSIDMDLVRIEPGSFIQERTYHHRPALRQLQRINRWREPPERPYQRRVTLTRPYLLGAFEVTNRQFELFDPSHRARRPEYQQGDRHDDHPVEGISWQEAQQFCRWLSAREGRLYRLPTQWEWEYAAKAATDSRFYWGEAFWDRSLANFGGLHSNLETAREDGYQQTAPVGMFPANPWGLYDILGNSYEWVEDWWHPFTADDLVDPRGPENGRYRMAKGGSWTTRPYAMYVGENDGNNPADLRDMRGFRVLVELP